MILRKVYFLIYLFFQKLGDMYMDFGDAQKKSVDGSLGTSLKGDQNSSTFLQNNNVEAVIYHNKPKKDANLNIIPQGIF